MNNKSIALQHEQIDELLDLLEMGVKTGGVCSQLRAHKVGSLDKINEEIASRIYAALGDVFDELQTKSDVIKMTLPLVIEKMKKELEPAQEKARELVDRFNKLNDLPRGRVRGDAQLAFHGVISQEMTKELNKVADSWGLERVSLEWCDHEINILSKVVPIHNIGMHPLGEEFSRLVNPERYWELFNERLDQMDLRIRINEQRDLLQELFNVKSESNILYLV